MEQLRVGFISSSGRHNFKPFRNQPLVILYLLIILEEKFGKRLMPSLIDLRGVEEENILYHIPENDIFMYSVTSPDFMEISEIVKSLRFLYPKSKHIAGGPHITLFPEESSKIFDTIVVGEGEDTIVNLIKDFLGLDLKPHYRQENIVDINSYPYPDRKFLPKLAVVETGLLNKEYLNLRGTAALFSRGCPFRCHFCANVNYGPVRYRSPKLIEEEIEYLKRD